MAIRNTQGGFKYYALDEIVEIKLKPRRKFFTRCGHAWCSNGGPPNEFFFSGISVCAPTGQTHVVVPDPIITELALQRVTWHDEAVVNTSLCPRYDQAFMVRAREQYQKLFSGSIIEKAMDSAETFLNHT